MYATFLEVSQDGKKETVYIRPELVFKVKKGAGTDPESQRFITALIDINGKTTLVEGTPSDVRTALQNPRP